jgi:two-component system NarL family sensor kinase
VKQFETRTQITVDADLEEVGKPDSQQLLHRAARELLTNIGKHADAKSVQVDLERKGDRIKLTIADDGRGFDPAVVGQSIADGHIGLGSLLARFDAMGGAMSIESSAGAGTVVTVTSPTEPVTTPAELGPRVSRGA